MKRNRGEGGGGEEDDKSHFSLSLSLSLFFELCAETSLVILFSFFLSVFSFLFFSFSFLFFSFSFHFFLRFFFCHDVRFNAAFDRLDACGLLEGTVLVVGDQRVLEMVDVGFEQADQIMDRAVSSSSSKK